MPGIFLNPSGCCCEGETHYSCIPCGIPLKDLTVVWTSPILGDGVATLVYDEDLSSWRSECVNGIVYSLVCQLGIMRFAARYFISGDCLDGEGQAEACTNLTAPPLSLPNDCFQCDPFVMRFQATGFDCPVLAGSYVSFIVYEEEAYSDRDDLECFACKVCWRVVDCHGDPVAGAEFTIGSQSCTTDAEGQCCIEPDPPLEDGDEVEWSGEYTDAGGHLHEFSDTLTVGCVRSNYVDLEVPAVNEITFHVTSGCDDSPVEGAHVVVGGDDLGVTDAGGDLVVPDIGGTKSVAVDADTDPPTQPYNVNHEIPCTGEHTINIELPCSAACTIRVHATGCNGLPIANADVLIDGVGVGSTDEDGEWTSGDMEPGTYVVSVSCDAGEFGSRFEAFEQEVVFSDCPDTADVDAALTPASGYHCVACAGSQPMADSVTLTDFDYGDCTLNYTSGTWFGQCTVFFPGGSGCPSGNFTIRYSFNPATCTLAITWRKSGSCPVNTGGSFVSASTTAGSSFYDNFCNTFFSFDGTIGTTSPIYPSGSSYTISE